MKKWNPSLTRRNLSFMFLQEKRRRKLRLGLLGYGKRNEDKSALSERNSFKFVLQIVNSLYKGTLTWQCKVGKFKLACVTSTVDKHVGKLLTTDRSCFYSCNFLANFCWVSKLTFILQRQFVQPRFTGSPLFVPWEGRPWEWGWGIWKFVVWKLEVANYLKLANTSFQLYFVVWWRSIFAMAKVFSNWKDNNVV